MNGPRACGEADLADGEELVFGFRHGHTSSLAGLVAAGLTARQETPGLRHGGAEPVATVRQPFRRARPSREAVRGPRPLVARGRPASLTGPGFPGPLMPAARRIPPP